LDYGGLYLNFWDLFSDFCFFTDAGLMINNYNQTGNAKGIGDYLNEFVDHKGWLENGVILDLTPILGPADESQLPIIEPGVTFSF